MTSQVCTFRNDNDHGRSFPSLTLALLIVAILLALSPTTALAAGSVVTKLATKVHHTTAVLNGHLDPEGDPGVTECKFEWGETAAYGNTAPCAQGDNFNAPADVSALVTGLSPTTTYHFRLHIETTSSGPFDGADQSFRTIPVPSEHPLIASFGQDGTSGSSFSSSTSPAVHHATRKLYVGSFKNPGPGLSGMSQLFGFDASAPPVFSLLSGFPINTLGNTEYAQIAVDNTALSSGGSVYFLTADSNFKDELNGVNASGTVLPGFPIAPGTNPGAPTVPGASPDITSVAVNSAGEIWIATSAGAELSNMILKYSPAGEFLGSLDLTSHLSPSGPAGGTAHRIVFDSDDNLYVALWRPITTSIWKFTASSGYTSATKLPEAPSGAWSLAFDPSTEFLYANSAGGNVAIYDVPSGKLFDEFATGGGQGITVDPANQAVYVGSGSKVNVYGVGAPFLPPTATTAPVSALGGSKATLNGFVDPEGQAVTECKFEYAGNKTAPCNVNPGSGSGDVAVSAEVTGLTPNTSYKYRLVAASAAATGKGEDESFTTPSQPVLSSPEIANLTHNTVQLKALVNPKGFATTYRFEYGTTTTYGTKMPVPDGNAGLGTSNVALSVNLAGLQPDTLYHWRVVAENVNGIATMADSTFTTFGPAKAETTGSPIRAATTAQLQGRVDPDGAPTTYRFEYGTQGPCDANPCAATPDRFAGSGAVYKFVSEQIEGLESDTTYHYRLIAESPTPGGPAIGEDMTVTTRASDAPLSHGRFPGPPGSDRAYEQVSLSDTGGNPVFWSHSVSDDGNRAFYQVSGGTPLSAQASLLNALYAERIETAPHQGGWHSKNIFPSREELVGSAWFEPAGARDLSDQIAQNVDTTSGRTAIWRLQPGQMPTKLLEPTIADFRGPVVVSEDASRVLTLLRGAQDPAHVPPNNEPNLYDISSGTPQLVGLMPDGSVPSCGAQIPEGGNGGTGNVPRARHWVSADGSLVFFQSCGDNLYVRNLMADETKLIATFAKLSKSTPAAAFFVTSASLEASDSGGKDLYRYDLGAETYECVTCIVSGLNADVIDLVVAEDGSRVYFSSSTELIRGAVTPGIYRVAVSSGDLAFVAPSGSSLGDAPQFGNAITPDGSALVFPSSNPAMSALGGQQNGGTRQFYRYDDRDRSVVCLSCPQDGSAPTASINPEIGLVDATEQAGANKTALSADGDVFAFATTNALLAVDQNTARPGQKDSVGMDVYEWRDGRLFLITDGLTDWPDGGPRVSAITPSGNDIFFTAAAQYTQDALDGYRRLYTARIGGGFEVSPPPKPCPLEVCQGTPKGAPEEQESGSGNFSGTGNKASTLGRRPCPKGRHKIRKGGKARCVKRRGKGQKRQRAKHDRRNAR